VFALSMGSSDYDRQPLDAWLDEVMRDTSRGEPCTQVVLVHKTGVEEGRQVWAAPINGKHPRELAEMFERKARSTAQDLGLFGTGVQMFELWAFYGNRERPEAWHPLVVKSKIPRDGNGSEGPAGHGPEAQRMRHLEGSQQQVYAKQAHLDREQASLITFLGSTLNSVLREAMQDKKDMIKMFAAMVDRQHEYRMQEIQAIKDQQWKDKLLTLAPAAVNTAFGKEVFPQSTADTALITSIVEGMADESPEMLEILLARFKDKPEIHGILSARVTEIIKAKTDKEEERMRALDAIPDGDPEADAGGQVIRLTDEKTGSGEGK
jgi:hypothetical protein